MICSQLINSDQRRNLIMFKKFILPLMLVSSVSLAGCSHTHIKAPKFLQSHGKIDQAKFWQRNNASSALYLQGPKAQQMLNQNIATCVNELKEQEKLGEIRKAFPANYNSANQRSASKLEEWNSPARDGFLYSEHLDYHDFESCMHAKGWERVEYLPYKEADIARQNWLDRLTNQKKTYGDRENVTTLHTDSQKSNAYDNLNE